MRIRNTHRYGDLRPDGLSIGALRDMIRDRDALIDSMQLERSIFVDHLAMERGRNVALQAKLDDLNAAYARMQREWIA